MRFRLLDLLFALIFAGLICAVFRIAATLDNLVELLTVGR